MRLTLILILLFPALVQAQTRASSCIAIAMNDPEIRFIEFAKFGAALDDQTVRLSYVDHSTYMLETPAGASAATDYTGALGDPDIVPDVVTMNRAHTTHFTSSPDPRIPHVLTGWNPEGGAIEHYLQVADLLVRNVPTDIRGGDFGGARIANGNSIFIFEVAGLCIGHLGHLHHEPSDEQYGRIGRLDIVMTPVDGGRTLDVATMTRVMNRLKSRVVLPMHWFGTASLEMFLASMSSEFEIVVRQENWVELSWRQLPERPTVIVLRPAWLFAE